MEQHTFEQNPVVNKYHPSLSPVAMQPTRPPSKLPMILIAAIVVISLTGIGVLAYQKLPI